MNHSQFEFSQLWCFVAVAEELSFRRAAERLNMTQPPLSRQIKLLEDRVGALLFERTNRRVRLTSAGQSFYQSAIDIIQRSEHATLNARQAARGEFGDIALGFVPSAGIKFIPMIVKNMAQDIPDVGLTPVEMMGYEVIDSQRSGRIDFGITRMRQSRGDLERKKIVSEAFVVAIPANHHLSQKTNLTISDFDGAPYVSYARDRGGFINHSLTAMFSVCGITPETQIEVSQTHAVINMVNHGIGFAVVPKSSSALQLGNVVFRDIDLPHEFRSELFLVSRRGEGSSVQNRVRDLIIDSLSGYLDDGTI